MARWGKRTPRSEDGSISDSIKLVSGSIRNPDEVDALDVELSISDTEITMRTEGVELGSWPSAAVEIRPIDSASFEFIAEGDRLILIPDDPATFSDDLLASELAPSTGSRRRRKSRKKLEDKDPRPGERPAVQGTELGEPPSKGAKDDRDRAWIRALDMARGRNVLGLDRVPVDEGLRGREHQHTWDHGAAAAYGPGKHICTICGKIRL